VEAATHKTGWIHFTDFLCGLRSLFNLTLGTRDILVMLAVNCDTTCYKRKIRSYCD